MGADQAVRALHITARNRYFDRWCNDARRSSGRADRHAHLAATQRFLKASAIMTIKAVYLITLRLDLTSEIWLNLPPTGRTLQCLRDEGG
jgi:hypothetical protein